MIKMAKTEKILFCGVLMLVIFACLLLCARNASADTLRDEQGYIISATGNGWTFENNTLTITSNLRDSHIASSNRDERTTSDFEPFWSSVHCVVVEEGVTYLGGMAFYEMRNLNSVTLPSTLETIESDSFWECTSLTEITLPASLKLLGHCAFYWSGLSKVIFEGEPPEWGDWSYRLNGWSGKSSPFSEGPKDFYYVPSDAWTTDEMAKYGDGITWHPLSLENFKAVRLAFDQETYQIALTSEGWTPSVAAYSQGGRDISSVVDITYQIEDESIATLDAEGQIHPLQIGITKLKASAEGLPTVETSLEIICEHQAERIQGKAASCEEDGYEDYWQCTVCKKIFDSESCEVEIEPVTIPALGHDWNKVIFVLNETEQTVLGYKVCKRDETHREEEVRNVTKELLKRPTDEEWGQYLYKATEDFSEIILSTWGQTVDILPLNYLQKLEIPDNATEIEDRAFEGVSCQAVILPAGCKRVGARAFADIPELIYVFAPADCEIDDTAFEGSIKMILDQEEAAE